MNKLLSYSSLDKVLWYVIIPLIAITIIFSLAVFFYNLENQNDKPNRTNYRINYWSSILGIFFGAVLLGVTLGFSLALLQRTTEVMNEVPIYIYLFFALPFLFLIFIIIYIKKFISNLNKESLVEKERSNSHYDD